MSVSSFRCLDLEYVFGWWTEQTPAEKQATIQRLRGELVGEVGAGADFVAERLPPRLGRPEVDRTGWIAAYRAGKGLKEIAAESGCSYACVRNWLRDRVELRAWGTKGAFGEEGVDSRQ